MVIQSIQWDELDTLTLFTATPADQIVVEEIKKKLANHSAALPIS